MKNFNNTIVNRTRDLPVCSSVPQPTAPPRALSNFMEGDRIVLLQTVLFVLSLGAATLITYKVYFRLDIKWQLLCSETL
jgi:hypothetical protein